MEYLASRIIHKKQHLYACILLKQRFINTLGSFYTPLLLNTLF